MNTDSIEELLGDIRAGRMVLLLDDERRENEGDLIMAAEHVTPTAAAFMIRHTSGIICVAMEAERLAQLELPQMVPGNEEIHRTAFTVSVDYRFGTTTGVSSSDRAATIRALADPAATARDFARPGHIFPLRARRGGVLVRAGHTEAAVDLCALAGVRPVAVLCELMNDDGTMARRPEVEAFARRHGLKIGTIADLIRHRLRRERSIERIADRPVATEFGAFRLCAYADRVNDQVHLALIHGALDGAREPLVRVHLADTLRDLIGAQEERGWPLREVLKRIAADGTGVVVLLRQEESSSDLIEAARATPSSAESSTSSAAADTRQSAAPGAAAEGVVLRTFGIGAQILRDLGVKRMRVLSAPKQLHGLSAFDLEISEYVD